MEKRDFLFLDEIAFCLDLLTNDLTTIIEEIHEKGQYAFSYEDLEVLNECCKDRLKNAEKHADECGKNLIKAISIFIDSVYSYIKEMDYFDRIEITRAGGVISSHCGPGTLGVLYVLGQ